MASDIAKGIDKAILSQDGYDTVADAGAVTRKRRLDEFGAPLSNAAPITARHPPGATNRGASGEVGSRASRRADQRTQQRNHP